MDRSTLVARGAATVVLTAVVVGFVVRMGSAFPEPFVIDIDTDEILALADGARHHGRWLAPGHTVTPTRIRLGPLWHDVVAVAMWLADDRWWKAWRLLVALDLTGVLVGGALVGRALGRWSGLAFVVVLLSDPLYAVEQAWPFWYQQHLVALVAPAAGAWLLLATSGGLGTLIAGAVLTGLASQVHAMAWTLLPVGVVAVVLARSRLRAGDVVVGLLVFLIAAWPMVRQVPALLDPQAWTTMVSLRADPAVHGDPWGALRAFAWQLPDRVTVGLFWVPTALVGLVVRSRGDEGQAATAGVVGAWLAAVGVVFALVAHRWHVHYGLIVLVPVALALAASVRALVAWRPAAGMVTVAVLAIRPLFPFDWGFVPTAPIPWELASVQVDAAEAFRLAPPELAGGGRLPHAFPCAWPGICGSEVFRQRLAASPGAWAPVVDLVLSWLQRLAPGASADPAPRPDEPVEPAFRMIDGRPRVVGVGAPTSSQPWHGVVLVGRGDLAASGWDVEGVDLPGDRLVRWLTAEVAPGSSPPALPTLPSGVTQVDAFGTSERWTLQDLGLVALQP